MTKARKKTVTKEITVYDCPKCNQEFEHLHYHSGLCWDCTNSDRVEKRKKELSKLIGATVVKLDFYDDLDEIFLKLENGKIVVVDAADSYDYDGMNESAVAPYLAISQEYDEKEILSEDSNSVRKQ